MAEAASGVVLSGAEKEKVWPGRIGADGLDLGPGLQSQLCSLCFAAAGEVSIAEEGVQRDRQPAAGERAGPRPVAGLGWAGEELSGGRSEPLDRVVFPEGAESRAGQELRREGGGGRNPAARNGGGPAEPRR